MRALEKEHKQLEQRVTDLTQGMSLLSGLTELHTKYLAHCEKHPKEAITVRVTLLPMSWMRSGKEADRGEVVLA